MNKTLFKYLSLACFMFSLSACNKEVDPSSVEFELKTFEALISIHTEEQKSFFQETDFSDNLTEYGMGEVEKTYPLAIELTWKVTTAKKYIVKVSESRDMSESISYTTKSKKLAFENAKVGITYYWTVDAVYKSNTFTSEVASFTTLNDGARNIRVDGVNNMRDLGGYSLSNGKTFLQGLIYRSAKFNESSVKSPKNVITSKGIETMKDQLGIKTDVDFRKTELDENGVNEIGGITSSPLGKDVNYINCPLIYEGSTVLSVVNAEKDAFNKGNIKNFFDVLGNRNNYPLVFHCTQGKDRTGALAYLIETLLGVSDNDMVRDYLFTNMSSIGGGYCKYEAIRGYKSVFNKYEGENMQEKAHAYLLDIGVTEATIENVISILTA